MSNANFITVSAIVNTTLNAMNCGGDHLPKEVNFGGYDRARASSQSQKFALRKSKEFENIISDYASLSFRTADIGEYVWKNLNNAPEEFHDSVLALCDTIGKKKEKEKKDKKSTENTVVWDKKTDTYTFSDKITLKVPNYGKRSKQIMIYSDALCKFMVETIQKFVDACDGDIHKFLCFNNSHIFERKDEQKVVGMTYDTALFGAMTASKFSDTIPASMSVMDMFSIDRLVRESDYYIASDDFVLSNPEQNGAANLGNIGLNSSCYFRYASMDLDIARENFNQLGDADEIIRNTVPEVMLLFSKTLPSGKSTSHLTPTQPSMLYITVQNKKQHYDYVNAFRTPVTVKSAGDDIVKMGIEKFVNQAERSQKFYDNGLMDSFYFCLDENVSGPKGSITVHSEEELKNYLRKYL